MLREGRDLLFVGFGPIVSRVVEAADALEAEGWSIGVINARFAKPLDRQLILDQARGKRLLVTFEESVATGGFGSAVLGLLEEAASPTRPTATSRSASSGSRATGSSTTARWRTCGGPCGSTRRAHGAVARITGGAPRRAGPLGGRRRLGRRCRNGRVAVGCTHNNERTLGWAPIPTVRWHLSCMGRSNRPSSGVSVSVTAVGSARSVS